MPIVLGHTKELLRQTRSVGCVKEIPGHPSEVTTASTPPAENTAVRRAPSFAMISRNSLDKSAAPLSAATPMMQSP